MSDNNQPTDPNPPVDPSAASDPNAGTPVAQDPAAADPNTGGEAKPHGNAGKTPWYMARINEETNRRQQAEQRAQQEAQGRADAEALLQRLQQGDKPPAGQQQPPAQRQPAGPTQEQYASDVMREAARIRLHEDSTAVKSAGIGAFGASFGDALNTLTAVGATSDDFVLDVLAVDKGNAHVILKKLADEPERAAALAGMNSRQRISELTRMAMAEQQKGGARPAQDEPPVRKVSGAPAPKPILQPSAVANENDWTNPEKLDNMSEAEANRIFSQQWDAKYMGRKSA